MNEKEQLIELKKQIGDQSPVDPLLIQLKEETLNLIEFALSPDPSTEAIKAMLEDAGPYGLEVEVVETAMNNLMNGMTIVEACQHSTREWDCERESWERDEERESECDATESDIY
jgi:hypothetical protein